jgi:hypothetical protein
MVTQTRSLSRSLALPSSHSPTLPRSICLPSSPPLPLSLSLHFSSYFTPSHCFPPPLFLSYSLSLSLFPSFPSFSDAHVRPRRDPELVLVWSVCERERETERERERQRERQRETDRDRETERERERDRERERETERGREGEGGREREPRSCTPTTIWYPRTPCRARNTVSSLTVASSRARSARSSNTPARSPRDPALAAHSPPTCSASYCASS